MGVCSNTKDKAKEQDVEAKRPEEEARHADAEHLANIPSIPNCPELLNFATVQVK